MNYVLNEPKPNIEAEQAVIGSILLSPDTVMPETFEILKADDFLVSEYRTSAASDVYKRQIPHFVSSMHRPLYQRQADRSYHAGCQTRQ